MKRIKTITYDATNYGKGIGTANVYGKGKFKIKKKKVVTTPRKTKIVEYGPVNRVGKQVKTKTITKKK